MNTMNNITPTEKVKRTQTLIAMESLIKTLGGRAAYIAWLSAMPEGTEINLTGGLDNTVAVSIAENTDHYTKMVRIFTENMTPVLRAEGNL